MGIDYCFMTPEETVQDTCPSFIMHNAHFKAIWAFPVRGKGEVPLIVKRCVEVLGFAGYSNTDITMKNEQDGTASSDRR